jgi:hypothetical protein
LEFDELFESETRLIDLLDVIEDLHDFTRPVLIEKTSDDEFDTDDDDSDNFDDDESNISYGSNPDVLILQESDYADEEFEIEIQEDYLKKNFKTLSEVEKRNLPLTFVLSLTDEYRVLYEAIQSKFTRSVNLERVSDDTLSLIADACALAGVQPEIIEYAHQRGV